MNLLDQLFGIMPESERLRQLYADGKALPHMPTAGWVWSQPKTALGMVRLPHVATTLVSIRDWPPLLSITTFIALGMLFIWLGYSNVENSDGDNPIIFMVVGAVLVLWGSWSIFDYGARCAMRPEAPTIEYAPGETVLFMLPRRHATTSLVYSNLVFRERWYIEEGNSSYWKSRQINSMRVTFSESGAHLMTASISIPKDAPISYHTTHYRHEWVLAISHVPSWGFTRTDHYLLWIGDGR